MLTGSGIGCGISQRDARAVHVDGDSVENRAMLAARAAGGKVTAIEGLAANGELSPVRARSAPPAP